MYQHLVDQQRLFFLSGSTLPVSFRRQQLKKLYTSILEYSSELEAALYSDFKKCKFETNLSEITISLLSIKYALKHINSWSKAQKVRGSLLNFRSSDCIIPEPYGVSLIISPWNYPFLLAIDPLIAAISAGNCVVLKPSELSPATSSVIQRMLDNIFPSEYIAVIQGDADVSKQLLEVRFDKIFFTGSTRTGRLVYEAAAKNLTPVTLELGGKSPCIVSESANLSLAAKRIIWGKMMNAGQTCIAPDYILVSKNRKEQLIATLIETIELFYGKNIQANPDFPRIINEGHFSRLQALLSCGAIVFGGQTDRNDLYISPTIIDNVTWDSEIMKDEIFGPILPILEFECFDEIVEKIKKLEKPLALYIFSEDKKEIKTVLQNCSFGGGCVNDTISHLLNHRLPFGGVGNSGIGSYHGKFGFNTFSHFKSIVKRATWPDFSVRYAPYREQLINKMKKML